MMGGAGGEVELVATSAEEDPDFDGTGDCSDMSSNPSISSFESPFPCRNAVFRSRDAVCRSSCCRNLVADVRSDARELDPSSSSVLDAAVFVGEDGLSDSDFVPTAGAAGEAAAASAWAYTGSSFESEFVCSGVFEEDIELLDDGGEFIAASFCE